MQRSTRSMLAASLRCAAVLAAGLTAALPANAVSIRALEAGTVYRDVVSAIDRDVSGVWQGSARDRHRNVGSLFGDDEGSFPATLGVARGRIGQSGSPGNSGRLPQVDFKVNAGILALHLHGAPAGTGGPQPLVADANRGLTHRIKSPGTAGGHISVPEPGTLALFGLGLTGLGLMMRRRKAR